MTPDVGSSTFPVTPNRVWRLGGALASSVFVFFAAADARADAASWMFVGGGASQIERNGDSSLPALMQLDLGMGTTPRNFLSFGALIRNSTFFGEGTDLALLQRTATRGFNYGDYGLALDLGAYQRWWGPNETGFAASLNAGAPFGLTLGLNGAFAADSSMTLGLVVGIDWARFTAHRRSGQSWWPSYPLPLDPEQSAPLR